MAARSCPRIGAVYVSTNDDQITGVAADWGARVIRCPAELADDQADSESALLHALDQLQQQNGSDPDLIVLLVATSPLRCSDDLTRAIEQLDREQADSLVSVRPVEGCLWRKRDDQVEQIGDNPLDRPRGRDSAETVFEENGSIYLVKPQILRQHRRRLGGKIAWFEMDPLASFVINEPADLERIEALLPLRAAGFPPVELAKIELLVLDFDGVLTDNRVWVDQDGREAVACHRGDGLGLERLRQAGINVMILSKETNPVVSARARKLNIECIQSCQDKAARLAQEVANRSLSLESVAFVGNDVNDLGCMQIVGLPIAVADALPSVLRAASWATLANGGHGAVREVADQLLTAKQKA